MFGIDPLELKKIKRDLAVIETALIALLASAKYETEDESIKNMCAISMKGLARCAIENTQEIVGDKANVAEEIFNALKEHEQQKDNNKETPTSS